MALARLKLSRLLGEFWWNRRDGFYRRWVESPVYPLAMHLVVGGGLACVLVVLGYAAFDRSAGALVASVIAVALYGLALAFLTSFGASVTQSARHAGSPVELLARCRKLLEQHDFVLLGETADSFEAARGASAGAESKWRGCPLESKKR